MSFADKSCEHTSLSFTVPFQLITQFFAFMTKWHLLDVVYIIDKTPEQPSCNLEVPFGCMICNRYVFTMTSHIWVLHFEKCSHCHRCNRCVPSTRGTILNTDGCANRVMTLFSHQLPFTHKNILTPLISHNPKGLLDLSIGSPIWWWASLNAPYQCIFDIDSCTGVATFCCEITWYRGNS